MEAHSLSRIGNNKNQFPTDRPKYLVLPRVQVNSPYSHEARDENSGPLLRSLYPCLNLRQQNGLVSNII